MKPLSQPDGLRVKCLRLTPATFGLLFETGRKFQIEIGLPPNSLYAGSGYDEYTDTIVVFFENDIFDVIPPNGIPDEMNIEIKSLDYETEPKKN